MNILILSAVAPPLNSPESIQVGRYLKHLTHHDITLVTLSSQGSWEPSDPTLNRYVAGIKEVIKIRGLCPILTSGLRRFSSATLFPDAAAPFHWRWKVITRQLSVKPDIIISRSSPFSSAVLGEKLARYYEVPWVMHMSDPWVDNPFYNLSIPLLKRMQKLERVCVDKAAIVTLTSSKAISFYQQKYHEWSSKFQLLPNVFDEEDMSREPVDFDKVINITFTGRLYGIRSVHLLLNSLERMVKTFPEIEQRILFSFAGHFTEDNIRRIRTSSLTNLRLLGPLTFDEAKKLQRGAAILLAIDAVENASPLHDVFFPSKILDYMASGRKIIAITSATSTTHEMIDGKLGWCFDQNTIDQLPDLLIEIMRRYQDRDEPFFKSAANLIEYEAKPNAKRLEEMLIKLKGI